MNEFIKAAEFVIWQIESAIDVDHWHREVDQPSLEKMNTLSGSATPVFQFVDEFRGLKQDDDKHRNVSFVWKDAVTGDVCDCPISLWEFDANAKHWKNLGTNPDARQIAINAIRKWIKANPADTADRDQSNWIVVRKVDIKEKFVLPDSNLARLAKDRPDLIQKFGDRKWKLNTNHPCAKRIM